MDGYNMMAGNRQMRLQEQQARFQNDLAMRQFAEERDEKAKRLAQTSKAAETFVKANPEVLTKLGLTDQEFANFSAEQQIGVVDGYYKSQAAQELMQQIAQRKQQMEQDQTFADTLKTRTRTMQFPAINSDPTGMVAFAGLPSRTAQTSPRVPNRDDLLAAMAAAPLSSASRELMNYRLLQDDAATRKIEYDEDPVSGQRFATFGNMMQPSGTNPTRIAAESAPTVSPDGKFFHDGKKWVAVKQLGFPEGSTIVTENGQTVIKGPDGRLLTPPRSGSPFAALFGGSAPADGTAAASPQKGGGPAAINSQEEYDALPSGAEYRDSQGNIRRKK